MKTRLAPLIKAFAALDLAFRIAGVIGGVAALATHLPSSARQANADAAFPPRMESMAVRAEQRAHAGHHVRIIRIKTPEKLTRPMLPPVPEPAAE
jgi:hypothetical protein